MSTTPIEPTPVTPATEPAPVAPPAPSAPAAFAPPPEPAPAEPKGNVWDDPKAAQAEIERLRRENAKDRTESKANAADEARKELAQSIGKILNPEAAEPLDPAELTKSLTTSQAEAKQARVELAVFRNAATAGGDPAALLDSSSFLASLAAIDPIDSAAVTAAIQSAVTANPRLGAASADPKAPAPNPAQGAGASGPTAVDQLTREQVEQMGRDGKHAEIQKARDEGRLDQILGIKS